MKKLNKSELEALASRINRELEKEAKVSQIELDKETFSDRDEATLLILNEWNQLSNRTRDYLTGKFQYSSKGLTADDIMKSLKTTQTRITTNGHWDKTVYESLVLAQIEANTVADLIDAVKKEFIKEC